MNKLSTFFKKRPACLAKSAKTGTPFLRWNLVFLLLLGLATATSAQVINEGFEADCSQLAKAFFTGCFPNWISTHGTPDNISNTAFYGPAFAGNKFAHGYVKYDINCPVPNQGLRHRGEGVAIVHNFIAGATYRLRYAAKFRGNIQNRAWILTNGLPNQDGSTCTPADAIPAIPAGSQTVHTPDNTFDWTFHDVEFMASANFGQLWFRAAFNTPSAINSELNGSFLLDAVGVELLCDPSSGVAAFNFENASGQPKTTFCYGEDVYLDGTASQNESRYFIDAWRRPIGSPAPFDYYSSLGWTIDQQVGVLNLSQLFANVGTLF
ncbi:MAG: hypothetical protein C7N36_05125 [Bacteroidetes bacterium]|nr:MAG: hypothetical protein C7N36_05125 [Bacteroidota bacterium]